MTYNDCSWVTICYASAPGRRFIQKHDTIFFYRFVNENPLRLLVQAVFRRKVFACDKVVDRYVKVLWKQQKHLKIGASFSVFVIWQSLAAYRQIHCDLQLCVALLFSDLPETHHLHDCFYPPIWQTKRIRTVKFFRLTIDIIVTICYNIIVTTCNNYSTLCHRWGNRNIFSYISGEHNQRMNINCQKWYFPVSSLCKTASEIILRRIFIHVL